MNYPPQRSLLLGRLQASTEAVQINASLLDGFRSVNGKSGQFQEGLGQALLVPKWS